MASYRNLVDRLKREFQSQKITYSKIGESLGVSESTVKRHFASGDVSLPRMQAMLDILGMDFADLVIKVEDDSRTIDRVTFEIEQALVEDTLLLLILFHILHNWTVQDLEGSLNVSRTEIMKRLFRLEEMGLIEVLMNDRIRNRVSAKFQWQPDGPLLKFLEQHVVPEFLSCSFNGPGELRLMSSGWLSNASLREIHQHCRRLVQQHQTLISDDRRIPLHDKNATSLIVAVRPWSLSIFDDYFAVDTTPSVSKEYWE